MVTNLQHKMTPTKTDENKNDTKDWLGKKGGSVLRMTVFCIILVQFFV